MVLGPFISILDAFTTIQGTRYLLIIVIRFLSQDTFAFIPIIVSLSAKSRYEMPLSELNLL